MCACICRPRQRLLTIYKLCVTLLQRLLYRKTGIFFFFEMKRKTKTEAKRIFYSQTDIAQLEWFDIQEKPLARIWVWHSCNSTLQFTIVAILKISISYDCRRANVYVRNLFLSFSLSKMSFFFRSFIFSSFWGDWFMLT